MVVQPGLKGRRVAGTVTLDRLVGGGGQELRSGRILNGEGQRRVDLVATIIGDQEVHARLTRCGAVVREQCRGLLEGNATTGIACRGAVDEVQPSVDLSHIARSVALHGDRTAIRHEGRRSGILDGERRRCGARVPVNVGGGEGHEGGACQPALIRHVGHIVVIEDRVDSTIVLCDGPTEGSQPRIQTLRVAIAITLHCQVLCSRGEDRIFRVVHIHVETRRAHIAVDVRGRVGHRGHTHRERVTGTVRGGQGGDATVVVGRRSRPSDDRTAQTKVIGLVDVRRRAGNDGVLIVRHGHRKAAGRGIASRIQCRVGHRRRADSERGTRAVRRGETGHCAVVTRRRLRPRHGRAAVACIVRLRDVGRGVRDGRVLIIRDGDVKAGRGHIAVDVCRRERHGRRAHGEGVPIVVVGRQAGHGAIVGSRHRSVRVGQGVKFPIHNRTTLTGIGRLRDVGGHIGQGRSLIVRHRDVEGRGRGVAMDVRGGIRHSRRTHREGIPTAVIGRQCGQCTVVGRRRRRPGHHSRAEAGIGRMRDVGRGSRNGRILIVRDHHVKAHRGLVSCCVLGSVRHRRRAHGECISTVVGRREAGHSTIVARSRLRPADHCATEAPVIVGGKVCLGADGGRLIVRHRDGESGRAGVGTRVGGREGDRRRTHRESGSTRVRGGQGSAVTVVGRQGRSIRHHCTAHSGIRCLSDVSRNIGNGRSGIVHSRHNDGHRGRSGIRTIIRDRQNHIIRPHIITVEGRDIDGEAHITARIIGTVVNVLGGDGGLSIPVEDDGQVRTQRNRRRRVFDGVGGSRRRRIATVVRRGEGHRGTARVAAIVTQSRKVVGPSHGAAQLISRSASVAGEPPAQIGGIARPALDRPVRGSRGQGRRRGVDNLEHGCGRGSIATIVRG